MKKIKFASLKNEVVNGPVGKKVRIGPIEAEIMSDEECAKADYFVCATKAQCEQVIKEFGYDPYPAGTKDGFFCHYCNEELRIALSGQKIAAMGAKPCCMNCVAKTMEEPN